MTAPTGKYGERQKAGGLLQNWLSDRRSKDCKVSRSELTSRDLESQGYTISYTGKTLDIKYKEPLSQVGFLAEGGGSHHIDINAPFATGKFRWEGYISQEIITLEDILRGSHPHISEITQAVYKQRYDIEKIKFIIFSDIINRDTVGFVSQLYNEDLNGEPYLRTIPVCGLGTMMEMNIKLC